MALDYTKFDTDIKHPVVPCLIPLPKYMEANLGFRIRGNFKPNGKQFSIALLQEDASTSPLTVTVRHDGWILRTDYTEQGYGPTEDDGKHPFKKGGPFDILIICRDDHFEIFTNNQFFTTFAHRFPYCSILDMEIYGDITLQMISFHHYSKPSELKVGVAPPAPDTQRPDTAAKIPLAVRSASKTGMRNVAPPPVIGSEPPPLGQPSGASLGVVSYAGKEREARELEMAKMKAPGIGVETPKLATPQIGVETPKIGTPQIGVGQLKATTPQIGVDTPKITTPQIGVDTPKITTPQIGVDTPKITTPQIGVQTPKIGTPQMGVDTPKIATPQIGVDKWNTATPQVGVDRLRTPQVDDPVRVVLPETTNRDCASCVARGPRQDKKGCCVLL